MTRKLAANGGASVWALLDELSGIVKQVEASNDPAFGTTGAKLRDALGSLDRTSKWLLERVASAPNDALAGATPYLRLFGSTLGGCMLAGEALAAKSNGEADPQRYVRVARFFAENVTVQAGSLEKTVTDSADAVNGADAVSAGVKTSARRNLPAVIARSGATKQSILSAAGWIASLRSP